MAYKVKQASKSGPVSVPSPRERPDMVLGSRPPDMYAPRIKPLDAQRDYGKPKQPDASGIGFSSLLGGMGGRRGPV